MKLNLRTTSGLSGPIKGLTTGDFLRVKQKKKNELDYTSHSHFSLSYRVFLSELSKTKKNTHA